MMKRKEPKHKKPGQKASQQKPKANWQIPSKKTSSEKKKSNNTSSH